MPVLTDGQTIFFDISNQVFQLPLPGLPFNPPDESKVEREVFFSRLQEQVIVYASGQALGEALLAGRLVLIENVATSN